MLPFGHQGLVHTAATSASRAEWHLGCQHWDTQDRDASFCLLQILFLLVVLTEVTVMNCTQQNLMWMKIAVPMCSQGTPKAEALSKGYVRNKHLPAETFFSRAQSAPTENKAPFHLVTSTEKKSKALSFHHISQSYQTALTQAEGVRQSHSSHWCTWKMCYMEKV